MKNMMRGAVVCLAVSAAAMAFGTVPSVNVNIADSSGKTSYKGTTNAKGSFETTKLRPGEYVVRFNSAAVPKGTRYAVVVSAGKKTQYVNGIAAEKFAGEGVAMKIDVVGPLNITGFLALQDNNTAPIGRNGKLMVWIPKQVGSNIAGHWAESDSAEAKQAQTIKSYSTKNMQDKYNAGSTPDQQGGVNSKTDTYPKAPRPPGG
ncbi:MAG: hypothetical protein QOI07_526 [Verrucomicrobiota bacterium]|jgi:hypothetical protein